MKHTIIIFCIILCHLKVFSQNIEVKGGIITDSIDVSSGLIRNVADPIATQDAATKAYVDARTTTGTMGTKAGQIQYWNGSTWVMIEPTVNTGASLKMIDGVPTWIGGSIIPNAPTIGTARAGAGQATINYTAPANNGGGTITSYTATSSPGGITKTVTQAGSGSITVVGLTNGVAYTFTVTATNAAGTSVASAASNAVTPVFDNFPSVTIGNQTWMAENLKTTKYNDGTIIPLITDKMAWETASFDASPAYCWYDTTGTGYTKYNLDTYGALYNWYAINTSTNGNKNVCPIGWHVPTNVEWTTLTDYLGG